MGDFWAKRGLATKAGVIAGLGILLILVVWLISRAGGNQGGLQGNQRTPYVTSAPSGQTHTPTKASSSPSLGITPTTGPGGLPTLAPTEAPTTGPASILISVNGVKHTSNGSSGSYSWTGAFANKAQTIYFTGNKNGSICVSLKVVIPGKTFYGTNYTQTFFSNTALPQGQVIVDPIGPYPTDYPVQNAKWSSQFQFC